MMEIMKENNRKVILVTLLTEEGHDGTSDWYSISIPPNTTQEI